MAYCCHPLAHLFYPGHYVLSPCFHTPFVIRFTSGCGQLPFIWQVLQSKGEKDPSAISMCGNFCQQPLELKICQQLLGLAWCHS